MKLTDIEFTEINIGNTPCVLYGKKSDKVFLCVHGLCGCKEEAERFARIAVTFGYCVFALDLPEHGGRTEGVKLLPWEVVPEIKACYRFISERFNEVCVRAESIGAYFTLLALEGEHVKKCLLVSPLTDMTAMIQGMLSTANADLNMLERKKEIPFGNTVISWEYYLYAKSHAVNAIADDTAILSSDHDYTVDEKTIKAFDRKVNARLCEMKGGEHYFHTPEQVAFMEDWETAQLRSFPEKIAILDCRFGLNVDNNEYGISPREYGELKLLLLNLDKIHTTPPGVERIKRNLSIDSDVVKYCKSIILNRRSAGRFCGKNLYVYLDGIEITVNRYSYTIITAKRLKNKAD